MKNNFVMKLWSREMGIGNCGGREREREREREMQDALELWISS